MIEKYAINGTTSKEDLKILVVGCGNSSISENMYDDGYVCDNNCHILHVGGFVWLADGNPNPTN